jgi:hypothetical protein
VSDECSGVVTPEATRNAAGVGPPCAFRWGVLKRLPDDYVGERHIVVVEIEGTSDTGWCEFEERPGSPPPGSDDGVPRVYLSEDEMKL